MEITEVRIYLREEAKLKAYATITFDGSFVVHNMRVIDGKNGLFVAMPSRKKKDGTHQDIAHPITADLRKKIEEAVLSEYNKTLANPPQRPEPPAEISSPEEFSTGNLDIATDTK
ncbi:MAG: hypothetical protein COT16_00400 [Elusimicrobia bacterium CG08_land_8_20_14_0_20_44_26]|nr:MAG: hypothetical protein COT16_00400 [Elusimicrobia bacterium CG08_land_8_20_14_0_20_44_26]